MLTDARKAETLKPIDKINSSRGVPRLSLDGQFWLRMACVLPFSLAAWAVLLWWVVQELPIHAAQLVDKVSTWTAEVVIGPVAAVVEGGKRDTNTIGSGRADHPASKSPLGDPQSWHWRGQANPGWPQGFAHGDIPKRNLSAVDEGWGQEQQEDPFSAAKFLDLLRRSNHSSVAFVPPRALFTLSHNAARDSPGGSSLLNPSDHKFTAFVPSRSKHHQTPALVAPVHVGWLEASE